MFIKIKELGTPNTACFLKHRLGDNTILLSFVYLSKYSKCNECETGQI